MSTRAYRINSIFAIQNILNGFEVSSNKIQVREFQIQVTLLMCCLYVSVDAFHGDKKGSVPRSQNSGLTGSDTSHTLFCLFV